MKEIPASSEDEIDLAQVLIAFWRGRFFIAAFTVICTVAAVMFAVNKPNVYTSRAVLVPAQSSSAGMSGLAQLSGLVGVAVGGGAAGQAVGNTAQGLALLDAREFVYKFIEKRQLQVDLVPLKDPKFGKNAEEKSLSSLPDSTRAKTERLSAYLRLKGSVSYTRDSTTGFITITFTHESPTIAQSILTWLIEDINQAVKERKINEANLAIEYLTSQLKSTELSELRIRLFDLIQSQVEVVMLATARPEFVFQVLDPPHVPEVASAPNRRLLVIMGCFLGACLGAFFWMAYLLICRLRSTA